MQLYVDLCIYNYINIYCPNKQHCIHSPVNMQAIFLDDVIFNEITMFNTLKQLYITKTTFL